MIILSRFESIGLLGILLMIILCPSGIPRLVPWLHQMGLNWRSYIHVIFHKVRQSCQIIFSSKCFNISRLPVVVRCFYPSSRWIKVTLSHVLLIYKVSHFWSLLRYRCLSFVLVRSHKRLHISILFVVLLLKPFLGYLLLEWIYLVKLANSLLVQAVHTFECSLSDRFLMICQ